MWNEDIEKRLIRSIERKLRNEIEEKQFLEQYNAEPAEKATAVREDRDPLLDAAGQSTDPLTVAMEPVNGASEPLFGADQEEHTPEAFDAAKMLESAKLPLAVRTAFFVRQVMDAESREAVEALLEDRLAMVDRVEAKYREPDAEIAKLQEAAIAAITGVAARVSGDVQTEVAAAINSLTHG
ncbi:hypothetical protein HQ563_02970 [bacterium]|nr:hypothetical protein [bacterium]